MKFSAEIQLLKTLASGNGRSLGRLFLAKKIDLAQLEKLLYEEQLGIYFHALAEEQNLLMLLPRNTREQLLWLRNDQRRRNEELISVTRQLQVLLGEASIEFLQLKGLPLAQHYWGGADRRFCWDLDLLVREVDRDRAICALQAAGYDNLIPALLPRGIAYQLSHATEFTVGEVPVDLHWCFRQRPGFSIDYEAVWSRREISQVNELTCCIPAAQDGLLIMLLGIAQDAERGHCRFRKLWDIYLWLKAEQNFDWNAFIGRCNAEGVGSLCLNMLALTLVSLDCSTEFPALRALLQDRSAIIFCSDTEVTRVLGRSRQHLGNRLWFARIQGIPSWRYLVWWTFTAPMRYLLGRSI
jgi:putative nucleotidyltransferase-like protein